MVKSLKLIETPEHEFNYLSEFSRNVQVANLRARLEKGIDGV